ncbi:MAG: polysaccharide chain length determinant protein (PEP-CTERM system associated) [Paraglaciecola sp.]|jgi:polysaccharide chain length determinant protein (PEP-CTERM system associated)
MQDLHKTLELITEYIKGVWVKKRYIMICTWLICPIGFVKVASDPDVFESSARVFVDTRSVLAPMLRGLALQSDPEQEVAMMVRTLLTRSNLEIIARDSDLDIETTTDEQFQVLIDSLARNIELEKAGSDNLYTISFMHRDPDKATTVVQNTLDLFVEGTKGKNRIDSDNADKFIDEQIDDYEARLLNAEQRLVNYNRKYSSLLPTQGDFYKNYTSISEQLEQTRLSIKEMVQQIASLSGQLNSDSSQKNGSLVKTFNDASSLTTRYDSRIQTLEATLDQLKLKYTKLHPEVIEINNLLDTLTSLRKKEIEEFFASGDTLSPAKIGSIANELTLEITRLKSQVASLRVRESDYSNKVDELKSKIDFVPQAEAERTALDRDYDITKSKYEGLLNRRESSDLARKADMSSESVQFKVLAAPRVPKTAAGPNRPLQYTILLVIGFAAGLGLAFLISQLNPVLIQASQLTALTSYPVLGIVSHLNRAHILKVKRTRLMVFILSSGLILAMYAVLMGAEIMKFNIYVRLFS